MFALVFPAKNLARVAVALVVLAAVGLLLVQARSRTSGQQSTVEHSQPAASESHGHEEHDHHHEGHDEANSLELSPQARANIGLRLATVELKNFERTVSIPGMVVERPGRSIHQVTAPLTGTVTRIFPIRGAAVVPGELLFELRLTHEDLVLAQRDFLSSVEELEVIRREIQRIERLAADGAIAGKTLIERKHEEHKEEAAIRAQHQALLLHGLSEEQIERIRADRSLLQSLTVSAPRVDEPGSSSPVFQVEELQVTLGQHVNAGDTLAVLTNHARLYIEGNAFEKDLAHVHQAAEEGRPLTALVESPDGKPEVLRDLKILYLAGRVDPDSRAFHFYVELPNALLGDRRQADGHRFVSWRFKPGQRMQLQVPVEHWTNRIVLPADAVAQDGVETYVFQPNGDHFDRRPVRVEYRDPLWAVIANDGSLFPGDQVAISGAQQMQLALKNAAGGGVDPHSGHSH